MNNIKICYKESIAEISVKKSRFIATVKPISSEEEAMLFLNEIKKHYYDARHNCYAYRLDTGIGISKQSDDGEPQGTAGKPMLEILEKENITNILVVVTRYFGGTLLGTGGLIRAYSDACKAGILSSTLAYKNKGHQLTFKIDYNFFGKLRYIIEEQEIIIIDTIYTENISLTLLVPDIKLSSFLKTVTEESAGSIIPLSNDVIFYLTDLNGKFLELITT